MQVEVKKGRVGQSMWLNQFCSQTTPYLLLDFPLPAFSLLHANQIRGPELTIIKAYAIAWAGRYSQKSNIDIYFIPLMWM